MKRTILNSYTPMVYATNTRLTSAPSDPQTSTFHIMSTPRFSVRLVALAFAVVLLCAPAAGAQPAQLVKDIHPGADSSNATGPVEVGGRLLFTANDGTNGFELWKSDGTAGGTQLFKEINPADGVGSGGSGPGAFTPLDGTLYFLAAESAPSGLPSAHHELWKTDGTPGGTEKVTEINSGDAGAFPLPRLQALNGNLVFPASDQGDPSQDPLSQRNVELWRSDGTAGGTQLVADINSGTASSRSGSFGSATRSSSPPPRPPAGGSFGKLAPTGSPSSWATSRLARPVTER